MTDNVDAEIISSFIQSEGSWVKNIAARHKISQRFLNTQLLLHLPLYSKKELLDSEVIKQEMEQKLSILATKYNKHHKKLYKGTLLSSVNNEAILKGKNQLKIQSSSTIREVNFKEVDDTIGFIFQKHFHYIQSPREDRILDRGLYIEDAEVPYAYVSFSYCKRNYQIQPLRDLIGLELNDREVLSMTRAFAFDNAPHNTMSKLFHQSHSFIKKEMPWVKVIVTAFNPFLGFKGGIFTGSSYTPYATAPMAYWYNKKGFYVPRSHGVLEQKIATPPIIWLAHGLDKKIHSEIERIDAQDIIKIRPHEYAK